MITAAVAQFDPSKVLETRPSDPVWWTPECTQTEREKEKRWREWRKHSYDPALQQAFTDSVTVAIATQFRSRRAKEDSLRRSLSTRWTKLKNAAGNRTQPEIPLVVDSDGREWATSSEKAEAFARFFSKKCSVAGPDLVEADLPDPAPSEAPPLRTIRFRPQAVRRLLARLDVSKATGPDGISARVLKECAHELAEPLSKLFALCFRSGVQPRMWKTANVVPIQKRSSRSTLRNYRPVSLLCIISKVMETLENRHIVNYFDDHHHVAPVWISQRPRNIGRFASSPNCLGKRCGL